MIIDLKITIVSGIEEINLRKVRLRKSAVRVRKQATAIQEVLP